MTSICKTVTFSIELTLKKKLGRITYGRLLKSPDLSPGHPRRFKPVYHEGSRRIRCWTVSDRKHKRSQELCLGPGHSNAECARFGAPNGVRCIGSPSNWGGGHGSHDRLPGYAYDRKEYGLYLRTGYYFDRMNASRQYCTASGRQRICPPTINVDDSSAIRIRILPDRVEYGQHLQNSCIFARTNAVKS
jgi:hypothetical protein